VIFRRIETNERKNSPDGGLDTPFATAQGYSTTFWLKILSSFSLKNSCKEYLAIKN